MNDVERLNAMQDHAHDGDDVGEGLLLLAVEGALLQSSQVFPTPKFAAADTTRERLGITRRELEISGS